MNSRLASTIRLAALGVLALGLSGFGPGGCGLETETPKPCVGLGEQACIADPSCQPRYDTSRCACAPCPPNSTCPECRCGPFVACEPEPTPPPACSDLDEAACGTRSDCIAIHDGGQAPTPCDQAKVPGCDMPVASKFVRCEPAACPAVMCFLYCPNGMKRDARGCETCECIEGCQSDADCAPDQFCSIPELVCPPGTACPKPTGVCEKRLPPAPTCTTNADCLPGQYCEFMASCMSLNCPPPPMNGFCRNMDCAADGECPPGSSCMADPLCSGADCGGGTRPAARVTCQADCRFLDETTCTMRPDCLPVYGSACDANGNCTPDRTFSRCDKATCPPVICDLYCEFGFQVGADGCEICACNPPPAGSCSTAADCRAGEVCLIAQMRCSPDERCPQSKGLCAPQGSCLNDTDCAAGESCVFLMWDCAPGSSCWAGSYGTCTAATPGCSSDADCSAGEYCDRSAGPNVAGTCKPAPTGCTTDAECGIGQVCWIQCGTPPVSGICRDATCGGDADCSLGQVCRPDPKDPCNGPTVRCVRAGAQICQSQCAWLDESACGARYDCRAVYSPDASGAMKFTRCE